MQGSPIKLFVSEKLSKKGYVELVDQFGLTGGWYKSEESVQDVLVDVDKGFMIFFCDGFPWVRFIHLFVVEALSRS